MKIAFPTGRDIDEWQVFLWNQPDDFLSRAQKLQLMLMLEANFNEFDPYIVVRDLLRHRDMWQGAVMDRSGVGGQPDLIKLRDIGETWNVDTLYITTHESEAEWESVLETWQADEITWLEPPGASDLLGTSIRTSGPRLLMVWWD